MLKIIKLTSFLFFLSFMGYAQVYVNKVDINRIGVQYINLSFPANNTQYVRCTVDYGQSYDPLGREVVGDKEGNKMKFKSNMRAVNYVAKQGWNLKQIYVAGGIVHYLMERENDEEAKRKE